MNRQSSSESPHRITVSLCMIVKNEEGNLSSCLGSVADLVDEMVVIDTGSTDGTRAVAAGFGARVFDFPWADSFAAARNESLRHARGEWVFWLDADEWLDADNRERLRRLLASLESDPAAYVMGQLSEQPGGFDRIVEQVRLFPNLPGVLWEYRVHEQVLGSVTALGGVVHHTDVVIRHNGYADADRLRAKAERNLRLAEFDLAQRPDDPYVLYNLGTFHQQLEHHEEAARCLRRALPQLRPGVLFGGKHHALLTQECRLLGLVEEAEAVCRAGRSMYPQDEELLFLEANLHLGAGRDTEAETALRALVERPGTHPRDGERRNLRLAALHRLGTLLRRKGRPAEAEVQWRAVLAQSPDDAVALLELGEVLITLERWQELETVLPRLEQLPGRREDAAVLRSRALLARREFAAARAILEESIGRVPDALRPRQALSHVLLFEGADPAAAEAALREVLRLAPDDVQAKRNLDALLRSRERSTVGGPVSVSTRLVNGSVPGRAPVSLCLIVKNEEHNLPACLGPVIDLFGETVVIDTGSSDRTREVAAELGAKVFEIPWPDSFAAARNESIRRATLPWIFWLDADDRVDAENLKRLRRLLFGLPDENVAYLMLQRSGPADGSFLGIEVDHPRLFRNRPDIRWDYRVHEQIAPAIIRSGARILHTDIAIGHVGYQDADLRRRKEERNLRLLRMQDVERPDDPASLFHLGWTLQSLDRHDEALTVLHRSLERAHPNDTTVRKLHALIARSHRRLGNKEEAIAAVMKGLERFPDDSELLFLGGTLCFLARDLARAETLLLRLLESRPKPYVNIGVDPDWKGFKGRYNLAVVYRDQGRTADAEMQFRAVLAEQPSHADAWMALADLLLGQGRHAEVEQTVAQLEADPARGSEACFLRSRLHLSRSEFDAARRILEEALERTPQSLSLRQALSHVLLRENRDHDATERAVQNVLELDPGNQQARENLEMVRRRKEAAGPKEPPRTAREAEEQFKRAEEAFNEGRDEEAATRYRALLEAKVTPGVMLCRLGMLADRRGDLDAAWDLHCRAVSADPQLPSRVTLPSIPHHHVLLRKEYAQEEVSACPICGGTELSPVRVVNLLLWEVYHPAFHPVRRWLGCRECGHAFAGPRPTAAALREIIADPPPAHLAVWEYSKVILADETVQLLKERRSGGDWLEVGPAEGALAGVAQDHGFRVCAVDIHPGYAEPLRRLGVEFLQGDIADLKLGGRQFDVLTMGDVIEHCPDPGFVLERVKNLLRPGGVLWLSTPDREGVWARMQGEKDGMWREGEHLQYFSRRSLTRLLNDREFAIVDFRLSKRYRGSIEVICERRSPEG
jgi:glycosyltransferase involved in cell wall biosynthesis/SAM-dependent methyltransferase